MATLAGANLRRLCARARANPATAPYCATALAEVEAERAKLPLTLWDDPAHGRSSAPP